MKVTVYSKKGCPYCSTAIQLLKNNNLDYTEYQLNPSESNYTENRNSIFRKFNHYSFPIVFFDKSVIKISSLQNIKLQTWGYLVYKKENIIVS